MDEPTSGGSGRIGGDVSPAARLAWFERDLVRILAAIRETERSGGDSWELRERYRRTERVAQALRIVVYAPDAAAAAAAAAREPPVREVRPSGLLRQVLAHTGAARRELAVRAAAGLGAASASETLTPLPGDPLRLAAREIVAHIRAEPRVSAEAHEAYVVAILREACGIGRGE